MESSGLAGDTSKELVVSQVAEYLSLLGGLSWTSQTRMDVAVFICSLQRAAKKPLIEHGIRLNRVAKWVKRKPAFLTYRKLATPCRTLAVSDSAFRKEDVKGLAMRGAIIGVSTMQEETPAGLFHVLEFYARKQRRVTRSTFSAELNGLSDSYEFGKLISQTLAEILSPLPNAKELVRLEETGRLPLPLHCCIDARSVFDALVVEELKPPSEASLIMMLSGIKEGMRCHTLQRLFWVDTKDMLADGLNKGSVSRQELLEFGHSGEWVIKFKPHGFSESLYEPIVSVSESAEATFDG